MNKLVSAKDTPTHRLTVKLEDGSFKTFYLTEDEARWMVSVINGADRFIILPKEVDPQAPSFYPKQGAWMQRMTNDEIEARAQRYVNMAKPVRDEEQEKRKAEHTKKAREWINANTAEFEAMQREAQERLTAQPGQYHMASKNVKKNLVWYEAMRAVYDKLQLNA